MKALVRWTIGPVSRTGKEILRESVKYFARLYPEFERVICYNHVEEAELRDMAHLVNYHRQDQHSVPVDLSAPQAFNVDEAVGCGWKLAPPRLNPDGLELFLDNDVVLRERLPELDLWLEQGDLFIIAEGLRRKRMYGVYDRIIPRHVHACAGVFGLPGGYDFAHHIETHKHFLVDKGLGGYDEQGLSVAAVVNSGKYLVIPITSLHISEDHLTFPERLPPAIHFVGANRKDWHRGWKAYRSRKILMM